jgi:hypothetical protein
LLLLLLLLEVELLLSLLSELEPRLHASIWPGRHKDARRQEIEIRMRILLGCD